MTRAHNTSGSSQPLFENGSGSLTLVPRDIHREVPVPQRNISSP
jgi:hypothetical protein